MVGGIELTKQEKKRVDWDWLVSQRSVPSRDRKFQNIATEPGACSGVATRIILVFKMIYFDTTVKY